MGAAGKSNERVMETAEERVARFKEGLESCLW